MYFCLRKGRTLKTSSHSFQSSHSFFVVKSKWLPWGAKEVAVRNKPWENKYFIDTGNHVFKKSLADVFV